MLFTTKNKNAATEVAAQKTQTPIVAKLIIMQNGINQTCHNGICIFIKFKQV